MSNWYRREPIKFIDGTMHLSLEEKGAYSLCIDLMHIHGGTIPDDSKWLSGVCGCTVRKWKAIRKRLLELGKLDEQNGRLSNFRATFEAENFAKLSRNLAEHGARGGRQRAENAAKRSKSNGVDKGEASSRIEEKRREETTANAVARARRLPADWILPEEYRSWAASEGWGESAISLEADKFRDYWISVSGQRACKLDWLATWRNWMRNVKKDASNGSGTEGVTDRHKLVTFIAKGIWRDDWGAEPTPEEAKGRLERLGQFNYERH